MVYKMQKITALVRSANLQSLTFSRDKVASLRLHVRYTLLDFTVSSHCQRHVVVDIVLKDAVSDNGTADSISLVERCVAEAGFAVDLGLESR